MSPWDVPPQPDESTGDLQWQGQGTRIMSRKFFHGIVRRLSNVFGWTLIAQVDVYDEEGEHTPLYLKAFRWAMGHLWGLTVEVRDWAGRGALWGAEVLLLSKGRDPTSVRRGIGIVLGTVEGGERAHFDVGVDILPNKFDPNSASLTTAYKCSVPCVNFLEIPPDTWVKMSNDVGFIFRGQTGFVEWWVLGGPQPTVSWQMSLGQMYLNGKRVLTES